MYNHDIYILSEKAVQFPAGEIYLVQSKIELTKKDQINTNDALYVNYPFEEAEKIIPYFESLGRKKQKRILEAIQESYGYKIRADDLFGKLIVILFFNIELYDLIIVGLVGLGENSINTLIEIGNKIVLNKKSKTIILTKISPELSEPLCVTRLRNE